MPQTQPGPLGSGVVDSIIVVVEDVDAVVLVWDTCGIAARFIGVAGVVLDEAIPIGRTIAIDARLDPRGHRDALTRDDVTFAAHLFARLEARVTDLGARIGTREDEAQQQQRSSRHSKRIAHLDCVTTGGAAIGFRTRQP